MSDVELTTLTLKLAIFSRKTLEVISLTGLAVSITSNPNLRSSYCNNALCTISKPVVQITVQIGEHLPVRQKQGLL